MQTSTCNIVSFLERKKNHFLFTCNIENQNLNIVSFLAKNNLNIYNESHLHVTLYHFLPKKSKLNKP